jgi:hypothetical protein
VSYDLEWVDLPEAAALARTRFEECCDDPEGCRHVPSCEESYFDLAAPYRYHLNAGSMGFVCRWMRQTGMTYQAEYQPFPAPVLTGATASAPYDSRPAPIPHRVGYGSWVVGSQA